MFFESFDPRILSDNHHPIHGLLIKLYPHPSNEQSSNSPYLHFNIPQLSFATPTSWVWLRTGFLVIMQYFHWSKTNQLFWLCISLIDFTHRKVENLLSRCMRQPTILLEFESSGTYFEQVQMFTLERALILQQRYEADDQCNKWSGLPDWQKWVRVFVKPNHPIDCQSFSWF